MFGPLSKRLWVACTHPMTIGLMCLSTQVAAQTGIASDAGFSAFEAYCTGSWEVADQTPQLEADGFVFLRSHDLFFNRVTGIAVTIEQGDRPSCSVMWRPIEEISTLNDKAVAVAVANAGAALFRNPNGTVTLRQLGGF